MIYGVHIKVSPSMMLKVGEESCSYCFLALYESFNEAGRAACLHGQSRGFWYACQKF